MIGDTDQTGRMDRRIALGIVVLLVVFGSLVAAPGGVALAQDEDDTEDGTAGEHTVGAVGVEAATVAGDIERARFERDLEAAATDEERAEAVAAYLNRSRDRLETLEARERRLDEARENGSMSAGEHDARTARIGARAEGVAALSTAMADAADDLPADLRREYGIGPAEIRGLTSRAADLAERTRGDAARTDAAVFGDIAGMVDAYNAGVGGDAGFLDDRLRDERIDLHVESPDGSAVVVSFRIDADGRFTEVRAGPRGDATLRAETDRETVRRVADSSDGAATFRAAVRDDDIRIEGVGLLDSIKWRLIDLAMSVG